MLKTRLISEPLLITFNSVVGVSIARFTFFLNLDLASPDKTWSSIDYQIWTGVELYVGIICGQCSSYLRVQKGFPNSNC